ncbi:NLI interacting factor-like phosphatase domain-containing protein, putative [Eimeria tenella]|uniref:Mitochondrial import inner membrane translocase subunit TIM50 n=1 Tax=Eimeria tenella TaxID=5802 RepID=U6L4W5_EIMTE|nr:NLI interacting factor-like phosphatase domain-containing protein, putative [Eimeria tenella]CDJ42820.1 NLI interacting factor-like phosphatase domain-containing protein, putative [Eimeria tenella]|eukprot:XP_013233570.1 NLI interacting factor-like phosphatase domain-containing protein, putative [Eimeria tenella]
MDTSVSASTVNVAEVATEEHIGYADLVVDKIDPHKLCSYRLFREYCTYQSGAFIKDLSLLGRELRNVIIIDNSTKAYLWHMENAIPIKSWFDDPNDTELLDLIPILRSLATVDDIRPMIREALLRYF